MATCPVPPTPHKGIKTEFGKRRQLMHWVFGKRNKKKNQELLRRKEIFFPQRKQIHLQKLNQIIEKKDRNPAKHKGKRHNEYNLQQEI